MIALDREWHPARAASAAAMTDLRSAAPARLPATYLELLAFSNGGEGPLPVDPFDLCLYSAEEVIEIEREGSYREFFPGLFVIGGNGGGEAITLDVAGQSHGRSSISTRRTSTSRRASGRSRRTSIRSSP